jgi:hypothetical protein
LKTIYVSRDSNDFKELYHGNDEEIPENTGLIPAQSKTVL